MDYLCSPRLIKKGPTPRPCHDKPPIKPRPQPPTSPTSPRTLTAQKPQGKNPVTHHSPLKASFDIGAVIIIERCCKVGPLLSSHDLFCSDKTLFYNMGRVSCLTSLCHSPCSVGHLCKSCCCCCKAGQCLPSVCDRAPFEEC